MHELSFYRDSAPIREAASAALHDQSTLDSIPVLPHLSVSLIIDALRHVPKHEIAGVLCRKIFPLVWLPGFSLFAAAGKNAEARAHNAGLRLIAYASRDNFLTAVKQQFGAMLIREASFGLAMKFPEFSAHRRLNFCQFFVLMAIVSLIAVGAYCLAGWVFWNLVALCFGLFFLSVIALRLLCLFAMPSPSLRFPCRLADRDLPIYTVLVPLFCETAVFGQMVRALLRLDYPREKLDIKLLIEESDLVMQRALVHRKIPEHFDVIIVPCGSPQTKPRALNYGLNFAAGSLLTVYDAEDIPEPQQLRRAANLFAHESDHVAALQAELCFYNPNENWLTRQFTIEYSALFGLLLPRLSVYGLPIPLGGAANHFRVDILRKIGAWDAHNVTEDADLGVRLARAGYGILPLKSRTYEEANCHLPNWIAQRARWLKGFLQSWLVHMRHPLQLLREIGFAGFWTFQALFIGTLVSALFHPFFLMAIVYRLSLLSSSPPLALWSYLTGGLYIAVFVAGYGIAIRIAIKALRRLGITGWWGAVLTVPAYWLLMSVAAWLAVWQFLRAPFHWNKTEHGLSSLQQRKSQNVA